LSLVIVRLIQPAETLSHLNFVFTRFSRQVVWMRRCWSQRGASATRRMRHNARVVFPKGKGGLARGPRDVIAHCCLGRRRLDPEVDRDRECLWPQPESKSI
jgi:hypothetical protein